MSMPLWIPEAAAARESNMARFMAHVGKQGLEDVGGPHELHRFSIAAPEQFWSCLWDFCGVTGEA